MGQQRPSTPQEVLAGKPNSVCQEWMQPSCYRNSIVYRDRDLTQSFLTSRISPDPTRANSQLEIPYLYICSQVSATCPSEPRFEGVTARLSQFSRQYG